MLDRAHIQGNRGEGAFPGLRGNGDEQGQHCKQRGYRTHGNLPNLISGFNPETLVK